MIFSRENQTKGIHSVCLLNCFSQLGERNPITVSFNFLAVRTPVLDLFWLAPAKVVVRILEKDELN